MNISKTRMSAVASPRLFPTLKDLAINHIATYSVATAKVEETLKEGEKKLPCELKEELEQALVNPIMLAVVQGDLNQTEALIKARSPLLLSVKGRAVDYSRRTIKDLTPFQAALCAWDDEMCAVLKQYMRDEEIIRQYKEIFPEGHEKIDEAQTSFEFSTLVNAITQSNDVDVQAQLKLKQNDSPLCQTFNQFRDDFTLRSQQETVFNPKHLLEAFEICNENVEHWDWNRRDLFWRQVIGYVQRFLPANLAQDVAQGLHYRVEEKEKSRRSFNFRCGDDAIFPLSFDSFSGLGFDYASLGMPVWLGGGSDHGRFLNTLCRAKTSNLQNLCSHTRKRKRLDAGSYTCKRKRLGA